MRLLNRYSLRLERRALRLRAAFRARDLVPLADRTAAIRPQDILLASVVRDERPRLDWFLSWYRRLGVGHFLFVDNASTDGSADLLAAQPDCSVWQTGAGYRRARFGMDWINALLSRHARDRWVVVADADELLVYPWCDTRPLPALTGWLDASRLRSMGALLVDMYADGEPAACPDGADPLAVLPWFDAAGYAARVDRRYGNLWIQGGPRMRVHFAAQPRRAPALNKIPLVKWQAGAAFVSSTHSLLPRGLNRVYDEWGGERISGALLHTKFLDLLGAKLADEGARRQHYAGGREYRAIASAGTTGMWTPQSTRYDGWQQLDRLGLISTGGWA
jgi:hypothetical protein